MPPPASCSAQGDTSSTEARQSAGSSSFDRAAISGQLADRATELAAAMHKVVPLSDDYGEYAAACERYLLEGLRGKAAALGLDPETPEVKEEIWSSIEHLRSLDLEREDPDSEYYKYASPSARHLRAEDTVALQAPVRARVDHQHRRLDRRLSGGRPRTRAASRTSSSASSRGDPDLGDEPPPARAARLRPGALACAIGSRA